MIALFLDEAIEARLHALKQRLGADSSVEVIGRALDALEEQIFPSQAGKQAFKIMSTPRKSNEQVH